jgi:hypothetical protein
VTAFRNPELQLLAPVIEPGAELLIAGPDLEIDVSAWVTSIQLEMALDQTTTITVSLADPEDNSLLRTPAMAGFFKRDSKTGLRRLERWNVWTFLGTKYVLSELSRTPSGLDLVFYDIASELLKRLHGPLKISRGHATRAQFVQSFARKAQIGWYVPDLNVRQPIADLAPAGLKALHTANASPGMKGQASQGVDVSQFNREYPRHRPPWSGGPALSGFTQFSPAQVSAIARWAGLPPLTFEQIAHGESIYYPGIWNIDPGGTHGYGLWQITPDAWGTGSPLLKPFAALGGVPGMFNPLRNAQMAKIMFDASGISPWYGTKYLTAAGRAQASGWKGKSQPTSATGNITPGSASTALAATPDRAYVQKYEFTVGAQENYWDASLRLASEVRWRRYTIFNSLVYASDTTLAGATPYEVSEDDDWFDLDVPWTITRAQKIDSLPVSGRLQSIVPAGAAISITDDTPLYGTWIVNDFRRDMLDPLGTFQMTLSRPRAPLPEPASTVRVVPGSGPGGPTPAQTNATYVKPFRGPVIPSRIDEGVDYTVPVGTDILAIGKAHVLSITAVSSGWRPWFLIYRLLDGPYAGRYVFIAEYFNPVHALAGRTVSKGSVIGHGTGGAIEMGWGSPTPQQAYAVWKGGGYSPDGVRTAAGVDFNKLMVSLGVPAGRPDSGAAGKLPILGHFP